MEEHQQQDTNTDNTFNLKCEQLKQSLIDTINNANLPIAIVFYMVENIYREIEKSYYTVLTTESQHEAQKEN